MSPPPRARPPHAVVVGASLAGLAAAEVLGRHVDRVTLVERDDLPHAMASPARSAERRQLMRAFRRVLTAPRVVVRSGLEATGILVHDGRVRGVHVRHRRSGPTGTTLTIDADLVVEASGRPGARDLPAVDGLLVVGGSDRAGPEAAPEAVVATLLALVLDRCLTEHLSRSTDLAGLSAMASKAVVRSAAAAPGGPAQAAGGSVEAC